MAKVFFFNCSYFLIQDDQKKKTATTFYFKQSRLQFNTKSLSILYFIYEHFTVLKQHFGRISCFGTFHCFKANSQFEHMSRFGTLGTQIWINVLGGFLIQFSRTYKIFLEILKNTNIFRVTFLMYHKDLKILKTMQKTNFIIH